MNYNRTEYGTRTKNITLSSLMPLICGLVAYKYFYNYYIFAFPQLSNVFSSLYTVITFILLVLFIPLATLSLIGLNKFDRKLIRPVYIIPACVIINIFFVMLQTRNIGIVSRSYFIFNAAGTIDAYGFYFAQINTWFCNMATVLLLVRYIKNKKQIIKCICSCMWVMLIPSILIILKHPEYLGLRESTFDSGNITFGGGIWNIGVVFFGSLFWPACFFYKEATKWQKGFIIFCSIFFPFLGIAGLSRTLVLMVAFSCTYYFVVSPKPVKSLWKIMSIMFLVLLFLILESNIINMLITRFTDFTSAGDNIRFQIWGAYAKHFPNYWLLGAPEGSVYNYYTGFSNFGYNYLPHSSLLNFTIRFGLISCVAYLCLIKNSFGIKIRDKQHSNQPMLVAGCISYISLAFINQTGYSEPIFYVVFGLLLVYAKIDERDRNLIK